MKPVILIVGNPHSFTSAVARFLLNNGGWNTNLQHGSKEVLKYDRYEDEVIINFVKEKKKFRNTDISQYLNDLPKNKTVIIKAPAAAMFYESIRKQTTRPIRVVYVNRNIKDLLQSCINKYGNRRPIIYYIEKAIWTHDFIVKINDPVYTLLPERLLEYNYTEATELLKFCGLQPTHINWDGIDKMKPRNITFLKYRINNFLFKILR